ncbi:MAG TPA: hypothetical protein VHX37_12505 [Acidobacteriaceae bacterium]|jgi:hypothetical protein|nr:hypothetical protein [Acidobacteriaceae bacterium]
MNELNKALGDISSIRRQVARTTEFRGYGPATLAATGVFAMLAAGAQNLWIPQPALHVWAYVGLWFSTAFVSAALTGVQMLTRSRRIHSGLSDEMIHMAVEQFLPAVGAGLLLTLVLLKTVPALGWMLPGIWQVIFSLGIFASCRFLPRPIVVAGTWYLLTGLLCIGLGDRRALSPWAMAVPFAAGQMLVAGILLFSAKESGDES